MSTNPINDFSRLRTELPARNSVRDLRLARRNTLKFLEEVKTDNFEWPAIADIDEMVRFYLSQVIDSAALRVYNEAVQLIQGTEEHRENYKTLRDAPKNCGGFKTTTAILSRANYFEQMVALDHVINVHALNWPVGRRTYCFTFDDTRVIPLYVSSRKTCKASVMTTILGAAKGPFKVPTYEKLAESEWEATHSFFIRPLECLEYIRQPYFSGATILKANAFDAGLIDHKCRYTVETSPGNPSIFACVEHKLQNSLQQAPLKEKSAGSNMLSLEKTSPTKKLTETLYFEDWCDEGYKDDVDTSFKVKEYWTVLRNAVRLDNIDELIDLTRKLFVSRVGHFSSPAVNAFYTEKLFQPYEE